MSAAPTPDRTAAALGDVARVLDGTVPAADHARGRERLLAALSRRRSRRLLPALLAAAVVASGVGAAALLLSRAPRLEYQLVGATTTEGEWVLVPADRAPVALRFSEGSEFDLAPSARTRVEGVTAAGARVVLGGGALRARVVHRDGTRWSVAAGPYSVEVTGTAFDVAWAEPDERLELRLHDGSVVVRGPSLGDGLRVSAGQQLVAHARTGAAELMSAFEPPPPHGAAPGADAPPASSAAAAVRAPAAPPRPPRSWSELLADGDFTAVVEAARARGIDATLSHGSMADLVALSDAARYVRDRGLARRGLLAERQRFAGSAEARAAAFLLGRMEDDAGARREALRWYDVYLGESPRGPFAAEALGRKLVALAELGDTAAARATATVYLRQHPGGAHATYARGLVASP